MARVVTHEAEFEPATESTSANKTRGSKPKRNQTRSRSNGEEFDYSLPRQKFTKFSQFRNFLTHYPDKRAISIYLYRLSPVINLHRTGATQSNIDVFSAITEVSYEVVRERHGGGRYLLKLTDANRKPPEAATSFMDIPLEEAKPILDPATLVLEDPKNLAYVDMLIAEGVLVRDQSGRPILKTEASLSQVVEEVKKIADKNNGTGSEIKTDLQTALFLKLIDRLGGSGASGDSMEQAFKIAERLHPSKNNVQDAILLRMVDRMFEQPPPVASPVVAPQADIFETYEKVDAIIERISKKANPVAAEPSMVAQIGSAISQLMRYAPQILQAFAIAKTQFTPPPVAAQASLAPPVYGAPGPVYAAPPPVPPPVSDYGATVPPIPMFNPENDVPEKEGDLKPSTVFKLATPAFQLRLREVGTKAIKSYQRGVNGWDFGASLCTMDEDGEDVHGTLKDIGASNIVMFLSQMVPELKTALSDPVQQQNLTAWMTDFLSYDPDEEDEEDDDPEDSEDSEDSDDSEEDDEDVQPLEMQTGVAVR